MKIKKQKNLPVDFPSSKDCPIEKESKKRNKKKEDILNKTKPRRKKLFEISFEVCRDLTEICYAYSKKEAQDKFLKRNGSSLDQNLKDSLRVKEISKEEFEKKYI